MNIFSAGAIIEAFGGAFKRFPLPMLIALVGTALACTAIDAGVLDEEFLIKWWMVALLALPIFIGVKAFSEAKNLNFNSIVAVHALAFAGLALYAWFFDPHATDARYLHTPRYIIMLAAAHLWVAFAPFIGNESVEDFWEYNKQLFLNLIIGGIFTLVIFVGLSLAILAVDNLFDLHINSITYPRLFLIVAGIFQTAYWLFHFPKDFHFDQHEIQANPLFQVLCKYILIPIATLYFAILYAYSGKIALTWSLPKGWVSSLVIGFAAAGMLCWLLNFLLKKYDDSKIISTYDRWFWPVLFPMVGLLMLAIGRRIMDYGVTEERFLVAHTGSWLLLCCVFFVIVRSRDIRFIPMSLTAFMLMGIYGPISGFELARRSQKSRLQHLLEQNGMWADGKAIPTTKAIDQEVQNQIRSSLDFLAYRNSMDEVMPWFSGADIEKDSLFNANKYEVRQDLCTYLKLDKFSNTVVSQFYVQDKVLEYFDVSGFDVWLRMDVNKSKEQSHDEDHWLSLSQQGDLLIYGQKGQEMDRFDLSPLLQGWAAKNQALPGNGEYIQNDSVPIVLEGNAYRAKMYLQFASCDRDSLSWQVNHLGGHLLLKSKGKK